MQASRRWYVLASIRCEIVDFLNNVCNILALVLGNSQSSGTKQVNTGTFYTQPNTQTNTQTNSIPYNNGGSATTVLSVPSGQTQTIYQQAPAASVSRSRFDYPVPSLRRDIPSYFTPCPRLCRTKCHSYCPKDCCGFYKRSVHGIHKPNMVWAKYYLDPSKIPGYSNYWSKKSVISYENATERP